LDNKVSDIIDAQFNYEDCRCAGNLISECDICFTLQFLCALVDITTDAVHLLL